MCGISILYNPGGSAEAQELFFKAWVKQEMRGKDATGIFAITDKGLLYSKAPVTASEFVPVVKSYVERRGLKLLYALGHARAATHGSPLLNRNNHPVVHVEGRRVDALIHNGIVSGKVCNSKSTDTDTEEILCALKQASSLTEAVELVEKNITGSFAVGYIRLVDSFEPKQFIVLKHISPLEVAEVDGAKLFASTLLGVTDKYTSVEENTAIDLLTGQTAKMNISYAPYKWYCISDKCGYYYDLPHTSYSIAEEDLFRVLPDEDECIKYNTYITDGLRVEMYQCLGDDVILAKADVTEGDCRGAKITAYLDAEDYELNDYEFSNEPKGCSKKALKKLLKKVKKIVADEFS